MKTLRSVPGLALITTALAACGGEPSSAPGRDMGVAATVPTAVSATTDAGTALTGLVLRYAPGGPNPTRFCTPEWSITNQTGVEVPGLLIRIAWQDAAGNVLQPVGEFGTLWENLAAGQRSERTLIGHPVDCRDLRIVVGRYACRNADAGHMPCPGPLHVLTEGGIEADLSSVEEGPLPGFPGPTP